MAVKKNRDFLLNTEVDDRVRKLPVKSSYKYFVYSKYTEEASQEMFSFLREWRLVKKFSRLSDAEKWTEKENRTFKNTINKIEYKIEPCEKK